MYNIGNTSRLFLCDNKAIVLIRNSGLVYLISFSSLVFMILLYIPLCLSNTNFITKLASIIILSIGTIISLFILGSSEKYIIDLSEKDMIKRKMLFCKSFKTISVHWSEKFSFKYITFSNSAFDPNNDWVWLLACSDDKKDTIKLIQFSNEFTFWEFQKLFNKKFPDHMILGWHD
jgi:hypothetical protein